MFATFDRYRTPAGTYDEMFDGEAVRGPYARIHNRVTALSPEELRARAEFLSRSYVDQGVTFDIGGEEQPFPLDLLPRVIDAPSWRNIEQGVAQRVRALEAFLDDVYGPGQCFADGVLPRRVVATSPHFHRV
ncbi:MAG TPA: circularly permuted type 2 ATP-grasp protein, partial [Arachnia sp.]|nr:circularly permuted type 2 ATP-grasp protein [Arachnia sp.]